MSLSDLLRTVRVNWIAVAGALVAGILLAGIWSLIQPRVYTATSSGYVAAAEVSDVSSSMVGNQLARSKVTSFVDVGSWRTVAEHVITSLKLETSPEKLVERVRVTNPTDTVIIHVSAQGPTPEEARDLAEAWIRGMVAEIENIEGAAGSTQAVRLVPGDSARLPTAPTSPHTVRNLALGALLGLALGVGYARIREWLDRRIRSADGVETTTGLSVVGTIPASPLPIESQADLITAATQGTATSEAFRVLRTNLQYMQVDDPPRCIVITSSLPGDGKSYVAANLAMAMAQTGQPTILVDADLRRPRIAKMFDLLGDAGLSDVIARRGAVADVVQTIAEIPDLKVLTSGPTPPNPSELLGSERMHQLLDELKEDAIVVIDSPPLLPVTDAAVLAHHTDGALVVAYTGKTTYDALDKALDLLGKANGHALGVVMNRVPQTGPGSLYYGYQYQGGYYGDGEDSTPRQRKTTNRSR